MMKMDGIKKILKFFRSNGKSRLMLGTALYGIEESHETTPSKMRKTDEGLNGCILFFPPLDM